MPVLAAERVPLTPGGLEEAPEPHELFALGELRSPCLPLPSAPREVRSPIQDLPQSSHAVTHPSTVFTLPPAPTVPPLEPRSEFSSWEDSDRTQGLHPIPAQRVLEQVLQSAQSGSTSTARARAFPIVLSSHCSNLTPPHLQMTFGSSQNSCEEWRMAFIFHWREYETSSTRSWTPFIPWCRSMVPFSNQLKWFGLPCPLAHLPPRGQGRDATYRTRGRSSFSHTPTQFPLGASSNRTVQTATPTLHPVG